MARRARPIKPAGQTSRRARAFAATAEADMSETARFFTDGEVYERLMGR